ncbi:ATP-binding cassette domain-containing protein [Rickettsiales bacterium]|nr:ATP-binding cassette domain-containing protein [Rickettsiales bacterium]
MDNFINIVNADIGYSKQSVILKNVNLRIREKDFIVIQGKNGAGKSTLLKTLYMKLLPLNGNFYLLGQNINKHSKTKILDLRKKIGVILQNNYLIPYLSINQNIELALQIQEDKEINFSNRIKEIIEWVGLKNMNKKKIEYLSEGQKQKVIIARALICRPKILIADEPMKSLDAETERKLYFLLKSINKLGTTVIMTDKEDSVAKKIGTSSYKLVNGELK